MRKPWTVASIVPRPQFEKLIKIKQADKHCKDFNAWQQFVTISYAKELENNTLKDNTQYKGTEDHKTNSKPMPID